VIGEVLTWFGVAAAVMVTLGLYRSAERANSGEADEDE
jgi:cytochrome oxidase assembly protein ShyY1